MKFGFGRGFLSSFTLFPSTKQSLDERLREFNIERKTPEQSIADHWSKVGGYMKNAMGQVEVEIQKEKDKAQKKNKLD